MVNVEAAKKLPDSRKVQLSQFCFVELPCQADNDQDTQSSKTVPDQGFQALESIMNKQIENMSMSK